MNEPLSASTFTTTKQTQKKPEPSLFTQPQSMTVKGALIGATITAFLSWNSGRYSRIGTFLKRWSFIRSFVGAKHHEGSYLITNYHHPLLKTVANNFYCYSGEPGIGKSYHFQLVTAQESEVRPSLYVSFKSIGRQINFSNDIAEQLNFGQGQDETGMISELIRAIKKIKHINKNPIKFQLKYILTNLSFMAVYYLLYHSQIAQNINLALSSATMLSHVYYINFMGPILRQSFRRTIPVIVFDDLNKIEQMNMLAEIVRFLKLVQDQAVNIILVSSDEETWSRLRREPGMKDRLRVRQIKYDYIETANRINEALDRNLDAFKQQVLAHQIYDKAILKALVRDLIALRQMSLRRFISVLRLVDEEVYETFIEILKNPKQLPIANVVDALREVLFDSEADTMVSNLKIIKRQLSSISTKQYLESLELLLKKHKLPEDNKIGSILKLYNIVRDLRSEYIINGRYTYTIYQMAVQKYLSDIKEYEQIGQSKSDE